MTRVGSKLLVAADGLAHFFCPACKETHHLRVSGPHSWGWNGSGDKPTFTPSIGHTFTQRIDEIHYERRIADRSYQMPPRVDVYCHSFITDGVIRFEADCTHEFRGQTMDLPDFPEGDHHEAN